MMRHAVQAVILAGEGIRPRGTQHVPDVGQSDVGHALHGQPVVPTPHGIRDEDPVPVDGKRRFVVLDGRKRKRVALAPDHVHGHEEDEVVLDPIGLSLERQVQLVVDGEQDGEQRAVREV